MAKEDISISNSIFGIPQKKGTKFERMIKDVVKEYRTELEEASKENVPPGTIWRKIFETVIVEGKTEAERYWIALAFGALLREAYGEKRENNVTGMLDKLIKKMMEDQDDD